MNSFYFDKMHMLYNQNKSCVKSCQKHCFLKNNNIVFKKIPLFSNMCTFLSHCFETINYHCVIYCYILFHIISSPEHEVLMVSYCGQWLSVVRRRASCVVCRPSTFDVYTLETTFVIRFLWNLIRMFFLTISRPSSNMGHVVSKTRSPGQILGNSCLHSRGHIWDPMLMKLDQNVCLSNF